MPPDATRAGQIKNPTHEEYSQTACLLGACVTDSYHTSCLAGSRALSCQGWWCEQTTHTICPTQARQVPVPASLVHTSHGAQNLPDNVLQKA